MDALAGRTERVGSEPSGRTVRRRSAGAAVIAALTCLTAVGGTAVLLQSPREPRTDPQMAAGSQQSAPACSWHQHDYDPDRPQDATYRATCTGAGPLLVSLTDGERLDGTIAGRVLSLTLAPGSDPAFFDVTWQGRFDDAPVTLHVVDNAVVAGSVIGAGEVACAGPSMLSGDWSWLQADPHPMPVAYAGDPRVSPAEASALCNLVTIGLPASSFGLAKGMLEESARS